jgi:hypothetical protein
VRFAGCGWCAGGGDVPTSWFVSSACNAGTGQLLAQLQLQGQGGARSRCKLAAAGSAGCLQDLAAAAVVSVVTWCVWRAV